MHRAIANLQKVDMACDGLAGRRVAEAGCPWRMSRILDGGVTDFGIWGEERVGGTAG
jgi:hypothetical protein